MEIRIHSSAYLGVGAAVTWQKLNGFSVSPCTHRVQCVRAGGVKRLGTEW